MLRLLTFQINFKLLINKSIHYIILLLSLISYYLQYQIQYLSYYLTIYVFFIFNCCFITFEVAIAQILYFQTPSGHFINLLNLAICHSLNYYSYLTRISSAMLHFSLFIFIMWEAISIIFLLLAPKGILFLFTLPLEGMIIYWF